MKTQSTVLSKDVEGLIQTAKLPMGGSSLGGRAGKGVLAPKVEFRRLGRKALQGLARELGLEPGQYDLRWNEGGHGVSGESTLHADELYVQLSANHGLGVLFRSCKGRKDYAGGTNNWMPYEALRDLPEAALRIRRATGFKAPGAA